MCPGCGKTPPAAPTGQGFAARCTDCGGLLIPKKPGPQPPPSSRNAFGKYTLDREIGRGSMGVVYDAHDTTLNRRVAIKIMHTHKPGDPKEAVSDWQRFIQEARLTANLEKHPNLITVYEAEVRDGRRFIAMEFVLGDPMNRWRLGENVTLRDQVRLLRDVALGVHHAHEHGIIHRDLKPGNILVTHGARPVVTDFGLATLERRTGETGLTPSGFIVGSPGYMSPEQARGQKQLDRTTDVYALGIILYEVLAGRVPFEGRTPVEILSRVIEGTKVPPSACGPDALKDEALDRICMKAISLSPADRYPTALAFANQLTEWLGEAKDGMRISPFRIAATVTATALLCAAVFLAWQHLSIAASVRRHLERADQRMKESNFTAALGSFEMAISEDPSNEPARIGRDKARRMLDAARPPTALQQPPETLLDLSTFHQEGSDEVNTSSPALITFQRNCTFNADVPIAETGEYAVTIAASCTVAKGEFAHLRVRVDGRVLAELSLHTEAREDYGVITRLAAGTRNLGIEFTNDYFDRKKGEDRNLLVHRVSLRRVK